MKKIAALLLALVMILALVGCDVSTRNYRRYPARTNTYDNTLGNTYGNTYGGAYDGNHGVRTRARTYNVGDAPLYNGNSYAGSAYNRAGTANPSAGSNYNTFTDGAMRGGTTRGIPGVTPGVTQTPANPTDGSTINRANNGIRLNRTPNTVKAR